MYFGYFVPPYSTYVEVDLLFYDNLDKILEKDNRCKVYGYTPFSITEKEPYKSWNAIKEGDIYHDYVESWEKGNILCNYHTLIHNFNKINYLSKNGIIIKDSLDKKKSGIVTRLLKDFYCIYYPNMWIKKDFYITGDNGKWFDGTSERDTDKSTIIYPNYEMTKSRKKLFKKNKNTTYSIGKWDLECEEEFMKWLGSWGEPCMGLLSNIRTIVNFVPNYHIIKFYRKNILIYTTLLIECKENIVGYVSFGLRNDPKSISRYEAYLIPKIFDKPYNIGTEQKIGGFL